jgi:hypothetical protein
MCSCGRLIRTGQFANFVRKAWGFNKMKRLGVVLLLLVCPTLHAQTGPWAGVLAPSRAVDWSNAGVVGGIPNRTNICSSLTSSATTAQINSAIQSCSAAGGGVVSLAAGTYSNATNGFAFVGAQNVTVRGAGANATFFATTGSAAGPGAATSIHINSSDNNGCGQSGCGPSENLTTWSIPAYPSGTNYPQGSNLIQIAKVANLKVGYPIILDQLDDTNDTGGILVCQDSSTITFTAPGSAGPCNSSGAGSSTNAMRGPCHGNSVCYSQEQIVVVTSCNGVTTIGSACSGTNVSVGISPGLEMPNWNSSKTTSAWWATAPAMNDGVEDLSVDNTNCSGCSVVEFYNAQNSWVKGVRSMYSSGEGHIRLFYANHVSVVNNYLFLAVNGASASYGAECVSCSDDLIENNIMQAVTTPHIENGTTTGTVFGFNFAVNEFYVQSSLYNIPAHGDHNSGIGMTLIEGNVENGATGDVIHGVNDLMTHFRNYYTGTQAGCWQSGSGYTGAVYAACNNNVEPMDIFSYHRFYNVIGNVLGTTGVNTTYDSGAIINGVPTNVYGVGYGNGNVPSDPTVGTTLMRWGNADPVTGFDSPRFDCGEVPTALTGVQAAFSNPCPSSDTLPASFYHSSTPSWWPSGKPWPPIGPDVTGGNILRCTSGTFSGSWVTNVSQCGTGGAASSPVNGLANSNPAMDCYLNTMGGNPDGTGGPYTFNENSCYAQTASSIPQPPTNLTATVD